MNGKHPLVRITTVTVFVVLMSGFVAFKSGAFDEEHIPVPNFNAGRVVQIKTGRDVKPHVASLYVPPESQLVTNIVVRDDMMWSSKTAHVTSFDWTPFLSNESWTSTIGPGGMIGTVGFLRKDVIISSSKSTLVLETNPFRFPVHSRFDPEQDKLRSAAFKQGHK